MIDDQIVKSLIQLLGIVQFYDLSVKQKTNQIAWETIGFFVSSWFDV